MVEHRRCAVVVTSFRRSVQPVHAVDHAAFEALPLKFCVRITTVSIAEFDGLPSITMLTFTELLLVGGDLVNQLVVEVSKVSHQSFEACGCVEVADVLCRVVENKGVDFSPRGAGEDFCCQA